MPPIIYKDHRGNRLPSVTTIIGRFKESGGLLYWANQQGLEGKTLDQARAEVTTPGTLAHKAVEDHINGRPETVLSGAGEVIEKARNAYAAYLHWEAMNRITFRHTEVSLASEQLRVRRHPRRGRDDRQRAHPARLEMRQRGLRRLSLSARRLRTALDRELSRPPAGRWLSSVPLRQRAGRFLPPLLPHHSTTRPKPSCVMRELFDRVKKAERRLR